MRYILTLNNISRSNSENVGFRALDLAILNDKDFLVPFSFVINNEAYEDFINENGIKAKVERIIEEKPDEKEAYVEIMNLYAKSNLSKEFQTELIESYESLAIEPGTSVHGLISSFDAPFVTAIRSPTYILPNEDEDGIIQNMKGFESLFIGLKLIWASAYSPESRLYRSGTGISNNFGMGVIIQKMSNSKASAVAYSRTEFNEYMIRIKSFKGLQDYSEPIIGKDVHEVDVNSLLIRTSQVNPQEYEITRDLETEELVRRPLLDEGVKQKMNDKVISEIARIAKRSKTFIGKDLKLYLSVDDNSIYVLQANRISFELKKEISSHETVTIIQDENGVTITEHVEVEAPKFSLPGLMSLDEAKEEILKNQGHRIFSMDGFLEEEKQEENLEKELSPVEEKNESREEKLSNLLRLKKIVDEMEEAVLNKNDSNYEEAVRKLKDLIK